MKCCTFCSKKNQMLYNHMFLNLGALCLDCYMQLQGNCAVCSTGFVPKVGENLSDKIKLKYISMIEKNIVVCDCCFTDLQHFFPEVMSKIKEE